VLVICEFALIEADGEMPPDGPIGEKLSCIDLHGRLFDHLMPHKMLRAIHSPKIASAFTPPQMYGVWLWEQGNARLATLAVGFCRRECLKGT
jgi:hypothetical protein